MADRQRLTWPGGKAASQPALPVERARAASAHPATPDEGAAHPAYPGQDPGEHDYENGDTSSWAEDPTKGPYPPSAHPAYPDEGAAHPAYKWAARDIRAAVESKAAKCIRIAQQILGPKATVAAIEDQALALMYLPDAGITATLNRLGGGKGDEEPDEDDKGKEAAKAAGDDKPDFLKEKEEEKKEDKKASDEDDKEKKEDKTASDPLSLILAKLGGIETRLACLETGVPAATPVASTSVVADEEAVLAQLLADEGMGGGDDVESMLSSMMAEEGMGATQAPMAEEVMPPLDIDMGLGDSDPMGMYGDDGMDDDEAVMLAQLYASDKTAGEDEEDEDEGKEAKKANARVASTQRPREKKASTGVSRLGGIQKEASGEIADLEKLWPSAPDISKNFT